MAPIGTFVISDTGKAVFKCALAYLLGSMCTFVPPLADLFGRQDSKHVIATVTVYFHPARSMGSMFQALIMAFTAFMYTATLSITSMAVSVLFTDYLHQIVIGHTIVIIFFVGGGLGFVGWVKLKKGDPLVNIACSLTSLSLISILTSEGAVQAGDLSFKKIGQYLKMIVAGVIATMFVSFLIFPVLGRRKFKKNMVTITDALSDMVGTITSGFISGDEKELNHEKYSRVEDQHRKSATSLAQNLKESKYELNVFGREREAGIQAQMVECVQRIAQSIGGLRSAAVMQFVIIKQPAPFVSSQRMGTFASYNSLDTTPCRTPNLERRATMGASIESLFDSMPNSPGIANGTTATHRNYSKFRSPRQIFELFIDHLGPSMKSLAYTLKEILDDLPFDPESNYAVENNPKFRLSLEQALELYKEARIEALQEVYNKKDMERDRPMAVAADWEEAAACCGQFSFCLLEVAEQVKEYLMILDRLELQIEARERTWNWLKFWKYKKGVEDTALEDETIRPPRGVAHELQIQEPVPKVKSNGSGVKPKFKQRLVRRIYNTLSFLRHDDKKFAIKVGFGAMLYALPSYIAATRPIYKHWRGEWGLLSYMLVCSMTIGASNTTGYQRFLGTCLGALLAVAAWQISNENPVLLAFFGFCMAYWTAYIIVGKGKGPLGRFIMLTYNLSALYAYTLTLADDYGDGDEEDDSRTPKIWIITGHRVVAVLTGCIWGLFITRAVWPISARAKLKNGLSLLWLRMGLIWKRDPLSVFIDGAPQQYYMHLSEEMELQRFLAQLQALVQTSKHEFSIRRAFPFDSYNRVLKSTSRMLEAFHTMNVVILKDAHATEGETALLNATVRERTQLCSRISHQFSVLASSMKLEYSMSTDALPDLEHTRDRLLSKVFTFRKEDTEGRVANDEDFSLLYTYALVTGQIGMEIQGCFREVEALFGVLDEESLWLQ